MTAAFRHSRLGARWGIPALALVPPFFAFNIAATPDPPHVDFGPVIGMYATPLSVWLVWLGARRVGAESPRLAAAKRRGVQEGTRIVQSTATPDSTQEERGAQVP